MSSRWERAGWIFSECENNVRERGLVCGLAFFVGRSPEKFRAMGEMQQLHLLHEHLLHETVARTR
ncbi:MAG: hypothetical protein HC895_09625 [Leptolyngbyaceae cyanobacterium SM1_3_5]|nr:hypothetical protein [Leptolyngbyaceae cyanobacterium SM1_3_5]